MLVVDLDKLPNGHLQFLHAAKDSTVQGSALQLSEPPFHRVQPGSTGRCEVQFEARVFLQPLPDSRGPVSRAVVQNHMQIQGRGRASIDLPQKVEKLLGPMSLGNPANYLTAQDVKSGVQAGGAMTFVVMGSPLDLSRT